MAAGSKQLPNLQASPGPFRTQFSYHPIQEGQADLTTQPTYFASMQDWKDPLSPTQGRGLLGSISQNTGPVQSRPP